MICAAKHTNELKIVLFDLSFLLYKLIFHTFIKENRVSRKARKPKENRIII